MSRTVTITRHIGHNIVTFKLPPLPINTHRSKLVKTIHDNQYLAFTDSELGMLYFSRHR